MNIKSLGVIIIAIAVLYAFRINRASVDKESTNEKICGLTLVSPPEPYVQDPMPVVLNAGAQWIAVVPYSFTRLGKPKLIYDTKNWQWWGERPEGIEKAIELAKASNIKIMMKPQVWIPGSWPGELDFDTDAKWALWESDYEKYIMEFVCMANQYDVEMICIGTEFRNSVIQREYFWRSLISKVRANYTGKITYSANWDDYQKLPFWDALDYVGVSAYFPLVDNTNPSVESISQGWEKWKPELKQYSKRINKPILFTEFGYLSVDRCAWNTWELEKVVDDLQINETAQANAYDALFKAFSNESYWAGGFLWKWFPNMRGHEGYPERDYTPQGKKAEKVIRKWYENLNACN